MKSSQIISSILTALFVVSLTGCKAREAVNSNAAKPAATVAPTPSPVGNSNRPVQAASSNPNSNTAKAPDVPEKTTSPALVGTYESREVEKEGVVTLISKLQTRFVFSADGRYSRKSTVNGKTYHSDSGQFRIDPPDKLVLSIQITGEKASQKVQTPPVEKVHRFSLSADGDELKLTSEKGPIATFQRVAKPKGS